MSATGPGSTWTTHEAVWEEAERLVVQEGWEYARVAEHLRVPLSTLQKRAAKGGWRARRQEAISYAAQVRKLKAAVLKDALDAWGAGVNTDERVKVVQLIHAWRAIEQAFPEHRYPSRAAEGAETDEDALELKDDDELLALIRSLASNT